MAATSAVSICSNASLMCGGQTINSLEDDSSDRVRLCANLYPMVRDYLLSSHPWNCCRKRVLLNPDSALPTGSFDYSYAYTLPADFARMGSVGQDSEGVVDYRIEDGKLLCDERPLHLKYLYLNTNEARWTPLMVMAATMLMRSIIAYPLTSSTSLEQLFDQVLEPFLKRARAVDSQDTPPETLGDFPLYTSRFTPTGRTGF